MHDKAILDGHKVVPVDDLLEWGRWFEKADRIVAQKKLPNGKYVSTVFLGMDYRLGSVGKPLWFETMVFDKKEDFGDEIDVDRYETWEEAEKGHLRMINKWMDR